MNADKIKKGPTMDPDTARGVRRWVIREAMGLVMVVALLFIPAGRLNWTMGWALVGVYALWVSTTALILITRSPELLAERATRRKVGKTWDMLLLSIVGLSTLAKYIIAGLDVRNGWTTPMPLWLQITALVVAALGYALGIWAMAANPFFSLQYSIQKDRGHSVASAGPYRLIRHPGYFGTIAFEISASIVLGSLWALIPGVIGALAVLIRTAYEDKELHQELDGYKEYADRVRYRLLPGVW